jgi:predicted CDP-diglyceride synthetase/phosphatidate cytidylyltransferase
VIIVAITAWHYMSSTMSISALKEMSQLETIRMLRAAGVVLFFFSVVLFGPYIVGASAFWTQMSSLGRAVPQLAGPIQGLLSSIQPAMNLDALTKLAVSQNVASAALVAVSGLVGSLQRRTRRLR